MRASAHLSLLCRRSRHAGGAIRAQPRGCVREWCRVKHGMQRVQKPRLPGARFEARARKRVAGAQQCPLPALGCAAGHALTVIHAPLDVRVQGRHSATTARGYCLAGGHHLPSTSGAAILRPGGLQGATPTHMRLSPSDSRRGITATCPALFLVAGAALAAVLLGARGAAAAACALQQPNISRTDFAVAYRASKVWEAAPRGRAPAAAYRQVCLALSADTPPAGGCGGAGFAPTDCCVQGDPKFGMATLALKPGERSLLADTA